MALYNKHRPASFDMVVGQDHVKKILSQQIKNGTLSNAYLFVGPAGTGKTTMARILCAMVNNSSGMTLNPDPEDRFVKVIMSGRNTTDVVEMDAASTGSINDIRELRERAQFSPMEMSKKIWIIDECHKLSNDAWQCLLKILEEPPPHVMFVLCTTDPAKIPETILTRVMVLRFNSFLVKDILEHIKKIAKSEGKDISEECLKIVAHSAKGSVRQALSNLDKIFLLNPCDATSVAEAVYAVSRSMAENYVRSTLNADFASGLKASAPAISVGLPAADFLEEVANYVHDLLICEIGERDLSSSLSSEEITKLKALHTKMKDVFKNSTGMLMEYIRILDDGHKLTVYNIQPQFHVDSIWVSLALAAKRFRGAEQAKPQG